MLRIATVFSGIGAIEHALERMKIDYQIAFACDNGGVDPWNNKTPDEIEQRKEDIHRETNPKQKKELVERLYNEDRTTNFVEKSYFANYDIEKEHYHQDITFLDGSPYRDKVDLFVGGSPCQSFSLVGTQGGLADTRGTLFYEFARLVKEIQPKVFIYENVKGMLNHDKGKTWETIQNVFEELGYSYSFQVLNAKDYGIPQVRNRLFVVGFKEETNFSFPSPVPLDIYMQDVLEEHIPDKYFLSEKIKKTILSTGTKGFYSKPETDLKIARTILSTMHKMHRAGVDNYVTTNGKLRRLTPREALRLMGFQDSFQQIVSDTQMYRQAGNSIVVDVLIALMRQIIETSVFESKKVKR